MAFNWWDSFYGQYIGVKIHGQLGKTFIYYVVHGRQLKRRYNVQQNLDHPEQIRRHHLFRHANFSWNGLSPGEQKEWKDRDKWNPTMSGYNYFISEYLKYWQPIFEEEELKLKNVQCGIKLCVDGNNDVTVTAVDMTKTIVLIPVYAISVAGTEATSIRITGGCLINSTTLRINVFLGASIPNTNVVWQVIEFE